MAWTWAGAGRRLAVVLALALAGMAAATAPAWAADPPHGPRHLTPPMRPTAARRQCLRHRGHQPRVAVLRQSVPAGSVSVGSRTGRPEQRFTSTRVTPHRAARPLAASGGEDPARCRDSASTTDPGCAYDYGWHAAAYALTTAQARPRRPRADLVAGRGDRQHLERQRRRQHRGTAGHVRLPAQPRGGRGRAVLDRLPVAKDHRRVHRVAGDRLSQGMEPRGHAGLSPARGPALGRDGWAQGSAPAKCSTSFTGGPTEMVQFLGKDGFDTNARC